MPNNKVYEAVWVKDRLEWQDARELDLIAHEKKRQRNEKIVQYIDRLATIYRGQGLDYSFIRREAIARVDEGRPLPTMQEELR